VSEIRPSKRKPVEFTVELETELAQKWGLKIVGVAFYAKPSGGSWVKVELEPGAGSRYRLPDDAFNTFNDMFVGDLDRGSFLSVRIGRGGGRAGRFDLYDFDSPWNFECKIKRDIDGPIRTYEVERPTKEAEIPDFRWRKRMEKYQ
jgi:hypothetical protein